MMEKQTRGKKGSSSVIAVILIAIVLILILYPPLLQWIRSLIGGNSYSMIGFRLYFTDGSYTDAQSNAFSITYGGRELSKIVISVNATLVADAVTAWQTSTTLNRTFTIIGGSATPAPAQNSGSMSGTSWTSGETKTIFTHEEWASEIETILGSRTSLASDWSMTVVALVTLTATVGGQPDSAVAVSPTSSLTIHYSGHSTIQSFSVIVTPVAFTL